MVCPVCNGTTQLGRPCRLKTCRYAPKCWIHTKVETKTSTIEGAGQGVFAKEDIPRNEKIADYKVGTKQLTKDEVEAKYGEDVTARFVWKKSRNVFYDGHPAVANTIASKFNTARVGVGRRRKRINARILASGSIRALPRRIPRGNEIFVPYGRAFRL